MDWLLLNAATMVNGLALAGALFIVAVGLSLVFGTMDVLNLAHGSIALIGGYVGVAFLSGGTASTGLALFAVLLAAMLGLLAGLLLAVLTSTLRDHLRQAMLTLGVSMIVADLIVAIFGADANSVPPPELLAGTIPFFGGTYPVYRLVMVGVGVLIGLALWLLIDRTLLGAIIRATVADPGMVEAIGVRTKLILAGVFGGGAALAAVGGLIAAPLLGAQPGTDNAILVFALVVVVIGGLGSLKGAAVGALVVGQVQTLGVSMLSSYASFLMFGVMMLVLLIKPAGLLPNKYGGGAH